MFLRRRSVRIRVALLVWVPLLFLIGFFAYGVTTSARTAITLTRSRVMMDRLGRPIADLQGSLSAERAEAVVYEARPAPAALAAMEKAQAATDRSLAAFRSAAQSPSVRQSASPAGKKALAELLAALSRLPALRAGITGRLVGRDAMFTAYNDMIGASYAALEQAVIQEGEPSQVLPTIAVVELAVSDEYLQQESALVNGAFTAGSLPAASHRDFVRLVGAHRLLYAQSVDYLNQAARADLARDVSARVAGALASMENTLVAKDRPGKPLPVKPSTWNATVATFNSQVQRVVAQAEARLAASARSAADAKLRSLLLTGGLGLAAVIVSVIVSLWIAATLTRQLAALRQSALELAEVQLPGVIRRLRDGEEVRPDAEVPPLDAEPDEIGQVKAAFNAARRTAVEAAVEEAKLRRGISDVFRNLARRSQSLLHRQMALLDALERRASDPESLEGLFRIDHLTTRMRRHAESLIVLAGDSPRRGWRHAVPFVDVLRAAAAEVEDYTRIKVIVNTPAALAGPAVADVIHLLAELAENATLYSPRTTQVSIAGELVGRGFAVEVIDRGLGLSEAELAELNARLADPPDFDLSGTDRLGLFVAARLARRHGISVSLTASPYGGVTAVALIPQALVVLQDALAEGPAGVLSRSERRRLGGRHALAADPGDGELAAPRGARPAAALAGPAGDLADTWVSGPLAGTQPAGGSGNGSANGDRAPGTAWPAGADGAAGTGGEAGWARASDEEPPSEAGPGDGLAGAAAPGGRGEGDGAGEGPPGEPPAGGAAESGADGPSGGLAGMGPGGAAPGEDGLPQRVPQASLVPQLSRPAPAGGQAATFRDPETARRVMSAFRRGWRQGLNPDTAPESAGEVPAEGGPGQ